jgi:hypothetical protein
MVAANIIKIVAFAALIIISIKSTYNYKATNNVLKKAKS